MSNQYEYHTSFKKGIQISSVTTILLKINIKPILLLVLYYILANLTTYTNYLFNLNTIGRFIKTFTFLPLCIPGIH